MELENQIPVDPNKYFSEQGYVLEPTEEPHIFMVKDELHKGCQSLVVDIHTGAWHCKAGCGVSGHSVVDFHAVSKRIDWFQAASELKAWGRDFPVHEPKEHGRCTLGALTKAKDLANSISAKIYAYLEEDGELDDDDLYEIFKTAHEIMEAIEEFGI